MRENCKITSTDLAPKAIGTYSQGIHLGNTIYFSGQIGLNPSSMELKPTFEEQFWHFKNLAEIVFRDLFSVSIQNIL